MAGSRRSRTWKLPSCNNPVISTQNLVSDTVLVTIMEGDGTFAAVYEDTLASGAGLPTLCSGLLMLMLAGQNNAVTTRPHAYFTFAVYHLHQY